MTTEADVPLPAEERTRRHRLIHRSVLEAQYLQRYGNPAVSVYALAVRDVVEQCPEIGPIDTWQKLADWICRARSDRDQAKLSRLRKKLSRHFTAESKGPPWQTVMLVLDHVLTPEFRQQKQAEFTKLYRLARGEEPPTGLPDERAEGRPGAQSGSHIEDKLRRRIAELEREVLDGRVEVSQLRANLSAHSTSCGLVPDTLPRQREPLGDLQTGTPNTRPFPTSQARDSAQGHYRGPRLDTKSVEIPGQSKGEAPYLVGDSWPGRRPSLRNRP
ncbi:hypothetical protein ACLQ28_04900 [Micromonospora sp. DT201]|uniref:hypothetical protein n=1 Tax=Micromonospora sp. DT201 TaxID=3393442 RepID=UPI003CE73F50